jgi:hypothetical protein
MSNAGRLNYRERFFDETPASVIRAGVWELIQIETFGQPARLTSSELSECRSRVERSSTSSGHSGDARRERGLV